MDNVNEYFRTKQVIIIIYKLLILEYNLMLSSFECINRFNNLGRWAPMMYKNRTHVNDSIKIYNECSNVLRIQSK